MAPPSPPAGFGAGLVPAWPRSQGAPCSERARGPWQGDVRFCYDFVASKGERSVGGGVGVDGALAGLASDVAFAGAGELAGELAASLRRGSSRRM